MMLQKPTSNSSFTPMTLDRMGSRYPSRLSFSRSMLRTMIKDNWKIKRTKFDLDKKGYGTVIYEINIAKEIYSLVCFSAFLSDEDRTDRVIAEKWDTAYTLHIGKVNEAELKRLKKNIPLQEAGRNSPKELVLSRGNKSVRLFKKITETLAEGLQPEINDINNVGYLLRTTAVYGSGKFGLSDFIRTESSTIFDQPFRAEMLAVYLIREFSVDLVEHVAHHLNPKKAVKLKSNIKQHLGIGNSTGLGMAPFIIKHPKLIHKWMSQFYKVIQEIKSKELITANKLKQFVSLLKRAQEYLNEVLTSDVFQKNKNNQSKIDLDKMIKYCNDFTINKKNNNWETILEFSFKNLNFDAQEITQVQLIELYSAIADPLAEDMSSSDDMYLNVNETIFSLINFIEQHYSWAINVDYTKKENLYLFWYISEEKLEPRLGERYNEEGAELEQPLGIGKMAHELYNFLIKHKETHNYTVAEFLLRHPQFRGIIRRIQTLSDYDLGEVNDNILAKKTLPINMLRFKLSFFGASRYDPKSDRWLRVSFFAGAPFYSDLNSQNVDNWGFATMNSY